MRILKLALISAVVLFAVLTAISFFLPAHVRISRAVDITAPQEKILTHLYYITAWRNWNKFIDSIPVTKLENDLFENVNLRISITRRTDSLISSNWRQQNNRSFNSALVLIPQPGNRYTLQWYFDFTLRWYPWEKFQSIVYDQQLGPVMEASLQQLKQKLER
jgi:hypothetical protein